MDMNSSIVVSPALWTNAFGEWLRVILTLIAWNLPTALAIRVDVTRIFSCLHFMVMNAKKAA
jgi:hypothetical protein